jgi:hypothetical protein
VKRVTGVNTDPDADRPRIIGECMLDLPLDRLHATTRRALEKAASSRRLESRRPCRRVST